MTCWSALYAVAAAHFARRFARALKNDPELQWLRPWARHAVAVCAACVWPVWVVAGLVSGGRAA